MTEPNKGSHEYTTEASSDTTAQPPALIYPLIVDSGNERVLREWIESHSEYAQSITSG